MSLSTNPLSFRFTVAIHAIAVQYASLFFIVGVGVDTDDENELGVLEFIHCLVETLDKVRLPLTVVLGRYSFRAEHYAMYLHENEMSRARSLFVLFNAFIG